MRFPGLSLLWINLVLSPADGSVFILPFLFWTTMIAAVKRSCVESWRPTDHRSQRRISPLPIFRHILKVGTTLRAWLSVRKCWPIKPYSHNDCLAPITFTVSRSLTLPLHDLLLSVCVRVCVCVSVRVCASKKSRLLTKCMLLVYDPATDEGRKDLYSPAIHDQCYKGSHWLWRNKRSLQHTHTPSHKRLNKMFSIFTAK